MITAKQAKARADWAIKKNEGKEEERYRNKIERMILKSADKGYSCVSIGAPRLRYEIEEELVNSGFRVSHDFASDSGFPDTVIFW